MTFSKVAKIYNEVIGDLDYEAWTNDVLFLANKHKKSIKTVLDLACGTGSHLEFLEKKYNCIGIDQSEEMVKQAKQNVKSKVVVGDMRTFNLNQKFDAVFCLYDSLNNLTEEEELTQTFKQITKHLNKEGILIFDVLTLKSMIDMAEQFSIQAGHIDDYSYIWENFYEDESWIWTFTLFEKKSDSLYEKHVENHKERFFSENKIKKALNDAKLELLEVVDAYSLEKVDQNTERINFVVRKK